MRQLRLAAVGAAGLLTRGWAMSFLTLAGPYRGGDSGNGPLPADGGSTRLVGPPFFPTNFLLHFDSPLSVNGENSARNLHPRGRPSVVARTELRRGRPRPDDRARAAGRVCRLDSFRTGWPSPPTPVTSPPRTSACAPNPSKLAAC